MKKQLITLIALLLPMLASAAVEIDGIYYNLVTKTKQAEVTSNPDKYSGDVVIPESVRYNNVEYSVTSIGYQAFNYCSGLTSVSIPNSVTSIGEFAFQYCSGLTSVTIPGSVTSFGENVFCWCTGLTSVTISNGVTNIGWGLFQSCTGLTSITIPNSVTSINECAFLNCSSLTSITIPNSVTSIGPYAFASCSSLISITIPNSVTTIDNGTFSGCSDLTSIAIPTGVTSIGYTAFENCSGLTSITIPNNVTSINSEAFKECSDLTSVTIGSGIKTIGSLAFASCSNLMDVYCYAEKVPNTSTNAFEDSYIEYTTLHVPEASVNAYKAMEPWKNFKSIVDLDGNLPEAQKCATPSINFVNGELEFSCETEGVEYVSEVTVDDAKKNYSKKVSLTGIYKVSVYATKEGYENSDVATKEIQISGIGEGSGKQGDLNNDGEVNAADAVTLVNIIMNKP